MCFHASSLACPDNDNHKKTRAREVADRHQSMTSFADEAVFNAFVERVVYGQAEKPCPSEPPVAVQRTGMHSVNH